MPSIKEFLLATNILDEPFQALLSLEGLWGDSVR